MKVNDLCMLVRLTGRRARFNGEFVRLLSVEMLRMEFTVWRIEPLFALPDYFEPLCAEPYLKRLDPEHREVRSWADCLWNPHERIATAIGKAVESARRA